jgi:hypothetical protein
VQHKGKAAEGKVYVYGIAAEEWSVLPAAILTIRNEAHGNTISVLDGGNAITSLWCSVWVYAITVGEWNMMPVEMTMMPHPFATSGGNLLHAIRLPLFLASFTPTDRRILHHDNLEMAMYLATHIQAW